MLKLSRMEMCNVMASGVSEYPSEGTYQAHLGVGTVFLPNLSNVGVLTLVWLEE